MYEQITQIANNIAALADPFKALEEMVALHTKQISELVDPTPPPPPPEGILFDACFNQAGDDGKLHGFHWHQNQPKVVPSGDHGVQSREGAHMMGCYLHRTESKYSYRTMGLYCKRDDMAPDTRDSFRFDFGKDYWLTVSMFLPDDWVIDPLTTILWQAQATPDTGEAYRQPCLHIVVRGGQWQIKSRWDTQKYRPAAEGTRWPNSKDLYKADIVHDLGRWTDWRFHIVWSWESNGLVEVWKNNDLVAARNGPNCSNDDTGPYPSAGVYEFSWREQYWAKFDYMALWRRVWLDSIRIGRQRTDVTIGE